MSTFVSGSSSQAFTTVDMGASLLAKDERRVDFLAISSSKIKSEKFSGLDTNATYINETAME
jgi:hypothetical protein